MEELFSEQDARCAEQSASEEKLTSIQESIQCISAQHIKCVGRSAAELLERSRSTLFEEYPNAHVRSRLELSQLIPSNTAARLDAFWDMSRFQS